jgi:hypothetical protein
VRASLACQLGQFLAANVGHSSRAPKAWTPKRDTTWPSGIGWCFLLMCNQQGRTSGIAARRASRRKSLRPLGSGLVTRRPRHIGLVERWTTAHPIRSARNLMRFLNIHAALKPVKTAKNYLTGFFRRDHFRCRSSTSHLPKQLRARDKRDRQAGSDTASLNPIRSLAGIPSRRNSP